MSEPKSSSDVFEIDRIRRLVELMKEHDLSEVDLRESRQRIRICRGPKDAPRVAYSAPPSSEPRAPSPAAPASKPADAANITVIKSPMVGTFYARPNPKAEPYVKIGDRVDTTTTVCIIEAMKVFNEIPAEVRGKLVAVLCEDGEAVEFEDENGYAGVTYYAVFASDGEAWLSWVVEGWNAASLELEGGEVDNSWWIGNGSGEEEDGKGLIKGCGCGGSEASPGTPWLLLALLAGFRGRRSKPAWYTPSVGGTQ